MPNPIAVNRFDPVALCFHPVAMCFHPADRDVGLRDDLATDLHRTLTDADEQDLAALLPSPVHGLRLSVPD